VFAQEHQSMLRFAVALIIARQHAKAAQPLGLLRPDWR
jgi:hypothetical protein